jgi:membrane protease YdiL (CAAX protease family)
MIPLAVAMLFIVSLVALLQDQLFGWAPDENSGLPLEEGNLSAGSIIVALIVVVGLAPLFEELFFRGVLFQYLRSRYLAVARGLFEAVVISGLAFAALHLGAAILPILPVGIILALVMNRWNSIWPAIALHLTYNAIVLVITLVSLS